jgi:hypothetical protein
MNILKRLEQFEELESQFAQVVKDTDEIKRAQAKQTVLSQETAVAIQELKTMMRKRYGSD